MFCVCVCVCVWCRARTRRVLADKLVRTIRRDQWLNLNEEKVRLYDPGESNGVGGKSGVAAGGGERDGVGRRRREQRRRPGELLDQAAEGRWWSERGR